MRTTAVRRTAIAASVASLAMLATACGGSDSGGKSDGAAPGAKDDAATKPVVKALTTAELEAKSLSQGDVEAHKITKTGPEDTVAADAVTVDKKECEPFGHAFYGVKRGTPVGTAGRKVVSEPEKDGAKDALDTLNSVLDVTSTLVTLASYDADGAATNLAEVRESAAKCAGGFTLSMSGSKQKIVKLTEEKATGGDEIAAWTLLGGDEGARVPFKLVLARQGGTLATFFSFNLSATGGASPDFDLPTAVVNAQLAKLG